MAVNRQHVTGFTISTKAYFMKAFVKVPMINVYFFMAVSRQHATGFIISTKAYFMKAFVKAPMINVYFFTTTVFLLSTPAIASFSAKENHTIDALIKSLSASFLLEDQGSIHDYTHCERPGHQECSHDSTRPHQICPCRFKSHQGGNIQRDSFHRYTLPR